MKKHSALDRRLQGYSRSASALRAVRRGLSSRGVRYSAAAAAGAALAGAGAAEAALITSPNQGFALSTVSGFNTASLDVDGDGAGDLGVFVSASFPIFFSGSSFGTGSTSPGSGYLYNYAGIFGRIVPGSASFNFSPVGVSSASLSSGGSLFVTFPAYTPPGTTFTSTFSRTAAFSFTAGTNTNPGVNGANAGWLRAVFQFGAGSTRISFPALVYNDTPGGSIHVGDVPGGVIPEPSTVGLMGLGLLALGARGIRESRRRKKKQS